MTVKTLKRREFLGQTARGVIAAGLGFPRLGKFPGDREYSPGIIFRTLGRTGLEVPVLSFGVMNSDSPDLLRRALEMGVRHIDTAHVYLRGNSETFIGKTLEEDKNRDKVILATKMRFNRDRDRNVFLVEDGREPGASAPNFDTQLELSLKRLRTGYVDILYLHSCYSPEMVLFEPMMEALVKAKEEGKTRFIGISTHSNEPACIRAAVEAGVYDVVLTAYNNLLDRRDAIKEAIAYASGRNIGVVAMKTHGGNELNRNPETGVDHADTFKWVLSDTNVHTTIPGMTSISQLEFNLKVVRELAETAEETRNQPPISSTQRNFYCQSCRSCIRTCSRRVEIPVLMRAYMYARGYGNLIQAETTLNALPRERGREVCSDCSVCTASCPNGIDIPGRLTVLADMGLGRPQ